MEEKIRKVLEESKEIVENKEPSNDISINWVLKNDDLKSLEEGIPVINFSENAQKRNKEMEFRIIRRITETQTHNDNLEDYHPDKAKHNRYGNIIPYKHSMVTVENFEYENDVTDNVSTYINANYINTSLNHQKRLIATQGPLTATFSNFWKMICNENVELIIMLCNLKENNKNQCDHYWPHKEPGDFIEYPKNPDIKELKVTFLSETIENDLYERTFLVEKKKGDSFEKRKVTQIQWTNWPDQSTPAETDYLVIQKLLDKMLTVYCEYENKKIVVHCSAGVGRTGTLIALFNLMLLIKKFFIEIKKNYADKSKAEELKNYTVSIFGIVRRLREQRWGMVHTSEQYVYLYKYVSKMIDKFLSEL